jgi:hypothetical protein
MSSPDDVRRLGVSRRFRNLRCTSQIATAARTAMINIGIGITIRRPILLPCRSGYHAGAFDDLIGPGRHRRRGGRARSPSPDLKCMPTVLAGRRCLPDVRAGAVNGPVVTVASPSGVRKSRRPCPTLRRYLTIPSAGPPSGWSSTLVRIPGARRSHLRKNWRNFYRVAGVIQGETRVSTKMVSGW